MPALPLVKSSPAELSKAQTKSANLQEVEIFGIRFFHDTGNDYLYESVRGKPGQLQGRWADKSEQSLEPIEFFEYGAKPSEIVRGDDLTKTSPLTTVDKLLLRMPAATPLNRENLRHFYHARALRIHPDRNPGKDTKEAFQKLKAAYERLLLLASE
jgi:hypothetical protein